MPALQRGQIWWVDLPKPRGSEPGYRRPMLVIQADSFNRSQIQTVLVAVITTNLDRLRAPGNVLLRKRLANLPKDSVINVSQVMTLDRDSLGEYAGTLPGQVQASVDAGLRLTMDL